MSTHVSTRLPSFSPKLFPASPDNCRLTYDTRAGFAACTCRRFGILWCDSKEKAKVLWQEIHLGTEVT